MKSTHKIVIKIYKDRRSSRTKENEKKQQKIIRLKKVEEMRI